MKAIHDLFKEEISIQSIALPTVKDKIKSDPILLQESHTNTSVRQDTVCGYSFCI